MRIADNRKFFGDICTLSIHFCGISIMMAKICAQNHLKTKKQKFSPTFSQAIIFHNDESSCAELLIFLSEPRDASRKIAKARFKSLRGNVGK
jgi:hypothetical protein